jgi:hypothetical protein
LVDGERPSQVDSTAKESAEKKKKKKKKKRVRGGRNISPAQSQEESEEEEAAKVINALLDWCRDELFPFLVEVDARMVGADPVARTPFLYQRTGSIRCARSGDRILR